MPDLDFQGATRVSGIAIDAARDRRPVDDLQLTLESDRADLSQTDLVTLLLTGRTASAAASQGGVVVAEQLAMSLGGMLQKGVGEHAHRRVPRPTLLQRHRPHPALPHRHAHHAEHEGALLRRAGRHGEAVDRGVQPGRRALPLPRHHRGGQQPLAGGDGPLLVRPLEPRPPRRQGAARDDRLASAHRGQPAAGREGAAQRGQAQDAAAVQRARARGGGGPRARAGRGRISLGQRGRRHAAAPGAAWSWCCASRPARS